MVMYTNAWHMVLQIIPNTMFDVLEEIFQQPTCMFMLHGVPCQNLENEQIIVRYVL